MSLFAIEYEYALEPDRLAEHRPSHRAFLRELADQGILMLSGPYADDGTPGALIIARGESAAEVLAAFDADPFFRVGLITDRAIRPWTLVIGEL